MAQKAILLKYFRVSAVQPRHREFTCSPIRRMVSAFFSDILALIRAPSLIMDFVLVSLITREVEFIRLSLPVPEVHGRHFLF